MVREAQLQNPTRAINLPSPPSKHQRTPANHFLLLISHNRPRAFSTLIGRHKAAIIPTRSTSLTHTSTTINFVENRDTPLRAALHFATLRQMELLPQVSHLLRLTLPLNQPHQQQSGYSTPAHRIMLPMTWVICHCTPITPAQMELK